MNSQKRIAFSALLVLWLLPSLLLAQAGLPDRADLFVNDFAGILSSDEESELRTILSALRQGAGVDAVVVTVDSFDNFDTGDPSIEAFATRLFNTWGIGDARRNNGVLILLAVVDRSIRIELGAGYSRGYDSAMSRIIDRVMIPAFKRGSYSEGLLAGARAVSVALSQPSNVGSPSTQPARVEQPPVLRYKGESRPRQMKPTPLFGLAGFGVLFLVGRIAWFRIYKRTQIRDCEKCHTPMEQQDDLGDDDYLSSGQQVEQSLGTVDYDVWQCPGCGHHTVHAYRAWFPKYKACPECHHRTVEETTKIIKHSTYTRSGKAKIRQKCLHCRHSSERFETLPRKQRGGNSNSSSSNFYGGSSSGGGFSGGSSGGGFSSGGGASGRW